MTVIHSLQMQQNNILTTGFPEGYFVKEISLMQYKWYIRHVDSHNSIQLDRAYFVGENFEQILNKS